MILRNKNSILFFGVYFLFIIFLNQKAFSSSIANNDNFIQKETYCIIKYSNIIYKHENKMINIPIFNGNSGDVLYTDLLKKQKYNYSILSNIAIPIKQNNAKMTLLNMLKFYKKNLFMNIDINKPTDIDVEQDVWYIYYNFDFDKIPCNMLITIGADEKNLSKLLKSKKMSEILIEQMEFYNNIEYFFININIGKYKEP